jgi:hypothetical protein
VGRVGRVVRTLVEIRVSVETRSSVPTRPRLASCSESVVNPEMSR